MRVRVVIVRKARWPSRVHRNACPHSETWRATIADAERHTIVEMMAKGTDAGIVLATADLDGTFARQPASGVEVVQGRTKHPYGVATAPSVIPRVT